MMMKSQALKKECKWYMIQVKMPQVYCKKLLTGWIMLLQLQVPSDDKAIVRTAMNQLQKHMDLKNAVDRWKDQETDQKTWLNFKAHFSKEKSKRIAPERKHSKKLDWLMLQHKNKLKPIVRTNKSY
jgi:hypothetical protein